MDDKNMGRYPDRYVITGVAQPGARDAGERVWLYWSPEGGGWWQWGPEGWAFRFEAMEGTRFEDAMRSAEKVGPFWYWPIGGIEARPVPAIVTVS